MVLPRLRTHPCTALLPILVGLLITACAHTGQAHPELYKQLGGTTTIDTFTHKAVARAAADPRTRRTFEGVRLSYLQQSISAHLCKVADGPCIYEGETMRNAHGDLAITGAEFDVLVQMLREEMDAANVSTAAKNELLRRLAPMRRDIVVR
ncbi:group 1 truncated hemoglobin [Aquabacterium sp.]|uniref:group I truncated hemoglobin n=1 Tax=Aquabacterium sp. TaxID=1872578 RepID=UPI0024888BE8|nr:group 1 truncated hemoglobin [Aquabacterium sp.]MDI1351126.1 group 1 truncated hemoglobin [Aquabacterium sp.]